MGIGMLHVTAIGTGYVVTAKSPVVQVHKSHNDIFDVCQKEKPGAKWIPIVAQVRGSELAEVVAESLRSKLVPKKKKARKPHWRIEVVRELERLVYVSGGEGKMRGAVFVHANYEIREVRKKPSGGVEERVRVVRGGTLSTVDEGIPDNFSPIARAAEELCGTLHYMCMDRDREKGRIPKVGDRGDLYY